MSTLNSLFSNIPEEKAPAAPLRRIYPLEKGNGNTQQRVEFWKGHFIVRSIKKTIGNAMLCFQSPYSVLLLIWETHSLV